MVLLSCLFLIGYGLTGFLPHYASWDATSAVDHGVPFVPGMIYPCLVLLFVDDDATFDRLVKGFSIIMGIAFVCFIAIPLSVPKNLYYGDDVFSKLTHLWHVIDTDYNTFPSLHVAFTVFTWLVLLGNKRIIAYWTSPVMVGIILSVLFIKSHVFVDMIGGIFLAVGVYLWYRSGVAEQMKNSTT
jgi:hypothetical protein